MLPIQRLPLTLVLLLLATPATVAAPAHPGGHAMSDIGGPIARSPQAVPAPCSAPECRLRLGRTDYLHRYSAGNLHEYTPQGQEDLATWSDMLTINVYPHVTTGEQLADIANRVLATYKSHKALVLGTRSVPRTAAAPAQHFIAAVIPTPQLLESVQARFLLHQGVGVGLIRSHRLHGQAAGPGMSQWLREHGQGQEQLLMDFTGIPSPEQLRALPQSSPGSS